MKGYKLSAVILAVLAAVIIPAQSAFAATTASVTINATPQKIAITNSPSTVSIGNPGEGDTFWQTSDNLTPAFSGAGGAVESGKGYFTLTNSSPSSSIDVSIKGSNMTGGTAWTLAGSVGADQYKVTSYQEGSATAVVLTTSNQAFIAILASGATKKWIYRMDMPSSFTNDNVAMSTTLTLTAVKH
jgi:hypothetical protein